MNLIAQAAAPLIWILAALLIAAAIEDSVRLRISNLLSLAILVLAVVAALVAGAKLDAWQNLAVFAGLLALGTLLFATGKFGGGDVKLLAVTGLWVDFVGALQLLSAIFIAGGLLALVVLGSRMVASPALRQRVAVLAPGAGIPYGVAISIGSLFTIAFERVL